MDVIVMAFIAGGVVGTLVSQVFRWRDLMKIAKYIDENNRLLMTNMDIVEENQLLLERLAEQQGINWSREGGKS